MMAGAYRCPQGLSKRGALTRYPPEAGHGFANADCPLGDVLPARPPRFIFLRGCAPATLEERP